MFKKILFAGSLFVLTLIGCQQVSTNCQCEKAKCEVKKCPLCEKRKEKAVKCTEKGCTCVKSDCKTGGCCKHCEGTCKVKESK